MSLSFRRGVVFCVAVTALTARVAFGQGSPIPKGNWTLHAVDSQETAVAGYAAVNAFDGNPNSFWATQWFTAAPPPSHEIQINLGAVYSVSGFQYLPRQDGQPHGGIAQYEFYVSMDGATWGPAVASGTLPNTATEKKVQFTAKTGRYVRLRALSEVLGGPWTTMAELNVLATGGPPPIPQGNWTLHAVNSQELDVCCYAATNAFDGNPNSFWATQWFSGAPSPPHEIQINLGSVYAVDGFRYLPRQDGQPHGGIAQYEFYVSMDGATWGTAVASGTFPNTGAEQQVLFAAKSGRYVRLRTLTEVNGHPWTTVAELNVLATGGPALISQGNWTLRSADSQELDVCCYAATNALDGNPDTFWATRWFGAAPPPPHEIQIDLGTVYGVSGFRYLPRQDGAPQGGIAQYQFHVSMDGVNWGSAVASGTFPNTAAEKEVLFTAKTGRYIRLQALTEVNGQPWTMVAELNVLATGGPPPISRGNWTLHAVDSQELDVCCYAATNALDGNPDTFWATRWFNAAPTPPHEIQINLGAVYGVSGFRYLPRQDGAPQGGIAQYQFYVSMDGVNWGTAVASGTFPNTAAEKEVLFTAKTGQYIRLQALTEVNGQPWTTVAELNVLASGNQAPNGTITSPAGDVTIAPGQGVTFSGGGSDPENNLPLTYAWNFGAGGPPSSTSQNPGNVVFANAGVYTVTFTVTDSLGAPDPTPATRTVTVQSASSVTLVPHTGWAVHFVDSQEVNVPGFLAPNVFDGNPNTSWSSQWFGGGFPPPHEIQIDLGASYSVAGFRYLPHQPWQAGRVGDYEFYVSPDGASWGIPVAVGAFPDLNTAGARDVMFEPKTGRYVRFVALNEVHGRSFDAIAELDVWRAGTGNNQAPTATMVSPSQDTNVRVGTSVSLEGMAGDPDFNLPLTYRWSVAPGSGIPDMTTSSPGVVHFDRAGVFPVTFTVTDALGRSATATRTVTVIGGQSLSKNGWSLRFVDSQETAGANNAAVNAFDGDPNTIWSSQWLAAQPPVPHEIQVDLGAAQDVVGFRYLPRQDGQSIGNIGQYEFYVSADGTNWGGAVAVGIFGAGGAQKEVGFPVKNGRYVRLRALSEVNGLPYTSVAELSVLQRQCTANSVLLARPRSGHVQKSSTLQLVADACPGGGGQGVRFVVDGVPLTTDFSAPYTATAAGLAQADHVVEAYLVDGSGNQVVGHTTYDRSTPVGIGDTYVAMGDGITFGLGDDLPTDDNSADRRNLLGGYTSVLADGLAAARGYPVTVANEGVLGATSATGAALLTTLLQRYPNANYFLLVYGHNDANVQRPSGRGLTPQSPGYAGSFKDYMQRIITAVQTAGKIALLGKTPAVIPVNGPEDTLIQEYNMVIDELVAANAIPVVPPDFHTYFKTRTATHYSNSVELNGVGYRSMADLWLQAILGTP
jgi:lysophospholipase L1-like esterase